MKKFNNYMTEILYNKRLIDYFFIIEIEIFNSNNENLILNDDNSINIKYNRKIKHIYPKNYYKEHIDFLNINTFLLYLPEEKIYLNKQKNYFFYLIFKSFKANEFIYLYFLRIYKQIVLNDNKIFYYPNYICFYSSNFFPNNFHNILEEIYNNSIKNNGKFFKTENILNILINRIYLPKYNSIQLNFCLEESYNFINSEFSNELDFNLLFEYLSIEHIILIIVCIYLNSTIIFFHNNIYKINLIIEILKKLFYPFPFLYNIIPNLNINYLELLNFKKNAIICIYKPDWKNNLKNIFKYNLNDYNIIYIDIDDDYIIIEKNVYISKNQNLPINLMEIIKNELYQTKKKEFKDYLELNSEINSIFFNFFLEIFKNNKIEEYILNNTIFDYDKFKNNHNYNNLSKDFIQIILSQNYFKNFIENYIIYINNKTQLSYELINKYNNLEKILNKYYQGENINKLFINNIYHTLCISSPQYEKILYHQNDIFTDVFHESLFKTNINYKNFILQNIDYKNYISFSDNKSKIIINEFMNKFKNNYNKCLNFYKDIPNHSFINNNISLELLNNLNNYKDINNKDILSIKENYIEIFDSLLKNNYKEEFYFLLAINMINIPQKCPICKKFNNIWDLRKEYEFSKAKRESRSKCKFCKKYFAPKFDCLYNNNFHFSDSDGYNEDIKNNNSSNLIYRKISFMCFQQLKNYKPIEIKKIDINYFYNILLLINEIKYIIEDDNIIYKNLYIYLNEINKKNINLKSNIYKKISKSTKNNK